MFFDVCAENRIALIASPPGCSAILLGKVYQLLCYVHHQHTNQVGAFQNNPISRITLMTACTGIVIDAISLAAKCCGIPSNCSNNAALSSSMFPITNLDPAFKLISEMYYWIHIWTNCWPVYRPHDEFVYKISSGTWSMTTGIIVHQYQVSFHKSCVWKTMF